MITRMILSGKSPLVIGDCIAPISKVSSGVYRVMHMDDTEIHAEIPHSGDLAVPQGYGSWSDVGYLFRRVDKIWIWVCDEELANAIDFSVKNYTKGRDVTFSEVSASVCVSKKKLGIARALGILGERFFPSENEPEKVYRIYDGWLWNVLDMNSYFYGLPLFENYNSFSFAHIATYWCNRYVSLSPEASFEDETLYFRGEEVEDEDVQLYASVFVGKKVTNIASLSDLSYLRVLALLTGVGLLRLENLPPPRETMLSSQE